MISNSSSKGSDVLFWLPKAPSMNVVHRHACRQNTWIHKIKWEFKKEEEYTLDWLGSPRSRTSRSGMNSRVVFDSVGSQGTCNAEQQFPWCSARCTAIQLQAVHSPWEIRFTSHLGPSSQGRWVLAPTFKSLGGPHSNHSQVYVWLVKPSHGELVPLFKACPATPSCFLSLFLVSSSA